MNPYREVITLLNSCGKPYVTIGGFAVVMHGSNRFTPDINVVLDLDDPDATDVFKVFRSAGYRQEPAGDDFRALLDSQSETLWTEGGPRHLSFYEPDIDMFSVQFLIDSPVSARALLPRSVKFPIGEDVVHVCSRADLIRLKEYAHRAQDMMDIENLEVVAQVADIKEEEDLPEEIREALPPAFPEGRVYDLIHFAKLDPEARLQWLGEMLQGLGSFCFMG